MEIHELFPRDTVVFVLVHQVEQLRRVRWTRRAKPLAELGWSHLSRAARTRAGTSALPLTRASKPRSALLMKLDKLVLADYPVPVFVHQLE
jgi:hypothetical protein